MLDYVKRSELDRERERRVRAEADRDAAVRESNRLLDALESERIQRENESVRHHKEIENLLTHIAPLAAVDGNGNGSAPPPSRSLPELLVEAMNDIAVGPAAIEAKRNKIAKLEKMINESAGRVPSEPLAEDELSKEEQARIAEKVGANG